MAGPGTIEIPILRLISVRFLLGRSCRLFGMGRLFLLEDLLPSRCTRKRTSTLKPRFWILSAKCALHLLVIRKYSCARLSAPIWAAFPSPIWEPITVGSAFATAQSTTNTEECGKVQLCWICPTSTIHSTKAELFSAFKKWSSPENPQLASGLDHYRKKTHLY